ncbi:superoxide dismutase family protein [Corynebacterium sp. NPDC060344]|uniref:superoxide dismutase family protein n=1 Tax=Corynebacterium sp. NPDC060344 TaxID=3347101 RepID=UPI00365B4905
MRLRTTTRTTAAALGTATLGLGLVACADGGFNLGGDATTETTTVTESAAAGTSESNESDTSTSAAADDEGFATAALKTADGDDAGTVTFAEDGDMVTVTVEARDLEPGFRGFHIHGTGKCEPDSESPDGDKTGDFLSAGGHLTGDADAEGHGNPDGSTGHAGDMPPLLVGEDGTATMEFTTDRLTRDLLVDDDGSAVMVHSKPDNFANVPERYAPDGPDADTKKTGDAGDRTLCGVVEESN